MPAVTIDNRQIAHPALEGENISTTHWEDARHWLSMYADLMSFKRRLLDRVRAELQNYNPEVRQAATRDLQIIENQMEGYQARLDLWYKRVWELRGLYVDPETRALLYEGREARLTDRELQLLNFLLDHPHRFYTAEQITSWAWAEPSLLPEEVRNYVSRTRKILKRLEIPCDLVNRRGHGYALAFRTGSHNPGGAYRSAARRL